MDTPIKEDMNLKVFLTFEESKFREFKQNPNPILQNLWAVYSYVPPMPTRKDIQEV